MRIDPDALTAIEVASSTPTVVRGILAATPTTALRALALRTSTGQQPASPTGLLALLGELAARLRESV